MRIKTRLFSMRISPVVILLLCLGFTIWGWRSALQTAHLRNRERFDNLCQEITSNIREKIEVYVEALYGARGLFAASNSVERDEWRAYVNELKMKTRYPGLIALEYVDRVKSRELAAYVQQVREDKSVSGEGLPEFSIYPQNDKEEYWPVVYAEPLEFNRTALGYDLSHESKRRETLLRSLETGEVSFSDKLLLRRFDPAVPGFYIALPVFKKGEAVASPEERRNNFQGFVVGVIKARDFFEFAYDRYKKTWDIDFEIFSGASLSDENLLFDSNQVMHQIEENQISEKFIFETKITVGGKSFLLHFWANPKTRASKYERLFPNYVLITGFVFSVLLYFFIVMMVTGRERAEKFADDKHKDLIAEIAIRKRAEEKTREAMKVKSDFTSTVSHELRTPLTVIKESISIVGDGTAGPLNDDQAMFLDKAKKNVDRLARLINDVLDYQKMESGKTPFHKTLGDLNDVVKEVTEDYREVALRQGMDLEIYLDPAMPRVLFDRDKIIQVIGNLLNNAIKFGREGKIFVSTEYDDNAVKVSVTDNGPGIKTDDKDKLFKSFSQLGGTNDRKIGGAGLGLVICKRIIEAHGGKIGVESVYHKGATFYFMIPVIERRMTDGR